MTLDNLCSGMIGVFVGAILSWIVAWWFALNSARDALRGKLLALKSYHLFDIEGERNQHFQKFRASYPDILAAVLAYRRLLPICLRDKLDEALYFYRGGKKNQVLKSNSLFLEYSTIDVGSELEFEQRIDTLLASIERID